MKLKKNIFIIFFSVFVLVFVPITFLAAEFTNVNGAFDTPVLPSGFGAVLSLLPLIVVLGLLLLGFNMTIAGFVAALLAIIISGMSLATANNYMIVGVQQTLLQIKLIMHAALAAAIFKSGGYMAMLALLKKLTKAKTEYIVLTCIILFIMLTYVSGSSAASVVLVTPLVFALVGAQATVIAAFAIAGVIALLASPLSYEMIRLQNLGNIIVDPYMLSMAPYWLGFLLLAAILAWFGARQGSPIPASKMSESAEAMSTGTLLKAASPLIFLWSATLLAPMINQLLGFEALTPFVYMAITPGLIYICTPFSANETAVAVIEGAAPMLARLFQVGLFLGFMGIIADTGVFAVMMNVVYVVPAYVLVATSVLVACALGIFMGIYLGAGLALIIPLTAALGFSPLEMGLVALALGFGSQLCVANITIQTFCLDFDAASVDIVKGNSKWIGLAIALLVVVALMTSLI